MAELRTVKFQIGVQEIICPATSTPKETLYLSNIDDQIGLRNHFPFVHFFPPKKSMEGQNPTKLIRDAVAKALVFFYPVAGRLRSAEKGKLVVECNGEGVIFREASADVSLDELRREQKEGLRPGFRRWEMLLVDDVWGSKFITDSPLLRLQVTTLACGGFVLAYTFNHCICDSFGAYLFMQTTSEFCRNPNQSSPSTSPSWGRELFKPRTNPTISYPHREYDNNPETHKTTFSDSDFKRFAQTSVFLSFADVSLLKSQIDGSKAPTFDVVAACLWRARTRTVIPKSRPETAVRFLFPIDTRFRCKPSLPKGYYGVAVVFPCIFVKATEIVEGPLSYVVGLISDAKEEASRADYRASVLDFLEAHGRRGICSSDAAFVVSDITRLSFAGLDFGWGRAVYGGLARAGTGNVPGMVTSVIRHQNDEGVEGVLAMVSLPPELLETFHMEVRKEIGSASAHAHDNNYNKNKLMSLL